MDAGAAVGLGPGVGLDQGRGSGLEWGLLGAEWLVRRDGPSLEVSEVVAIVLSRDIS